MCRKRSSLVSIVSSPCLIHTGEQLQINQPSVYDCNVPESLASLVPALADICKRNVLNGHISPPSRTVSNRSVTLTSADGTNFLSFAKGASFHNGLTSIL